MTIPAEKPMSLLSTEIKPLLLRHSSNPILTSRDWPYPINSVFNAGATLLGDGATCCFAVWKIDADFRIFVPLVLATASMDGKSTNSPP